MIKKLLALLIVPMFLFAFSEGDVDKGHTYYKFIINPLTGIRGDIFTKEHTKKEWEVLFSNKAKGFKEKYSSQNLEFKEFLSTPKFEKIAPHLEAFAIYYAKDSEVKPQCGE